MPCADCEMARDLERHARLVALGLEEAREVELAALTPEERESVREDEAFLERLLDVIRERRYSVA
jgi:hypothetical protein